MDADRNGFGVELLSEKNATWVLLKFAVEINFRPKVTTIIDIKTWIEAISKISTSRNFSLTDQTGTIIGAATSQWCIIDTHTRRPLEINAINQNCAERVLPETIGIKLPPKLKEVEADITAHHTVSYSNSDFNSHLNAIRYIEMMLDELPLEIITKSHGFKADFNFIRECHLGETVGVKYTQLNSKSLFEIVKSDGTPSARATFDWHDFNA